MILGKGCYGQMDGKQKNTEGEENAWVNIEVVKEGEWKDWVI